MSTSQDPMSTSRPNENTVFRCNKVSLSLWALSSLLKAYCTPPRKQVAEQETNKLNRKMASSPKK